MRLARYSLYTGANNAIACDTMRQGAISCATAQPPVAASAGALTLVGSPSFCREINFVAIYALLDVPFSAPAYTLLDHSDGHFFNTMEWSMVFEKKPL